MKDTKNSDKWEFFVLDMEENVFEIKIKLKNFKTTVIKGTDDTIVPNIPVSCCFVEEDYQNQMIIDYFASHFDFEGAIEGEADFSLDSSECFCDNFSLKIFIKSEKMPNSEELRNILNKLIEPNELEKIEINVQKNQNWQKKWMDNWEPFYLTNNIVVCPSWKDFASKKNEIIIKLDPANAFGTGVHATTKLCSQKICEIIDKNTRMIDIGTGSGILSIVASAFNASLIFAIDNDINVIKTAKENFDKNKFCSNSNIRLEFGTCYEFQSMKFNLIVANLLHHIIARDVHVYKKMLEENGKIILSGILKEKLPIVEEAIDKENLTIVSRDILDNWVCLVVEKK